MAEKFELIGDLVASSGSFLATISGSGKDGAVAGTTAKNTDTTKTYGKVAPWGDNNDFPNSWENQIANSTEMTFAANDVESKLFSNGIEYVKKEIVDGKKSYVFEYDEDFENLVNSYWAKEYLLNAAYQMARHQFLFPELIFDTTKSKVQKVVIQKCTEARFGLMNEKGIISSAYLNRRWPDGKKDDDDGTTEIKVLSASIDVVPALIQKEKHLSYILKLPVLSRFDYYPEHSGYSAVRQKWVAFANKLPIYKEKLMDRQTTWKYHLEINQEWLKVKYKEEWDKATPEQKQDIFKKELTHFNEVNKGVDKTGGNFATTFWYDENGNKQSSWIVNSLDGQTFSGEYNEDGRMASERIFWAWQVNPSSAGGIQPAGHTAGSGSDIKASFNTSNINIIRRQELMLMPIIWAATYNGLDLKNFEIRFKKSIVQDDNQQTPADRVPNNQK